MSLDLEMPPKTSPAWGTIQVGDALPAFDLTLTPSVIVAGAIASRDFMPVHHDRAYAMKQGAPDIFMNILTTNGYVSRYVTDWAGPEARITKISIRLGVPALPGDTMRFTGAVTRTEAADAEGVVEIALRGTTSLGDHVTGKVELTLPLNA